MDFGNIIRQVYEPSSESLNVNIVGSGSPSLPSTVRLSDGTGYLSSTTGVGFRALDVSIKNIPEILISHADDSIRLGDGTNLNTITQNGVKYGLDVNIINTTLNVSDTNALTELQSINTKLTSPISTTISGTVAVAGPLTDVELRASAVAISASSLPLPTGAASESTLASINSKLNTLGQKTSANSMPVVLASDQTLTVNADLDAFSATPDNVMVVGSIDGTKTGTKYGFVYNLRQQVLDAHDRNADFTYADFGTKNERITRIDYTSGTFSGFTIRRDFNYTLVSGNYRRDDEVWSVI